MNYDEIEKRLLDNLPIVYPTSTQPALGCYPNKEALDYLYKLKNRPQNSPVSLAVSKLEDCYDIVSISPLAIEMEKHFPKGSLTFLLPAIDTLDPRLGGDVVALRPVSHPVALNLVKKFGPLTATSANVSGFEPAHNCKDAIGDLNLPITALVDGNCKSAIPSTIIQFISDTENSKSSVIIMREGVVPSEKVTKWMQNQK